MSSAESDASTTTWQPIKRIPRRVLGVLVEKAKTTRDNYPLSLNALVSGCNQKSNRSPQMNLTPEQVEDAIDVLRGMQAAAEVHGDGRVVKYRHYIKDWLGIDGAEVAVMAELLLRGAQTVGELRGRAARMAHGQLSDMSSLRPVLTSLIEKKLVIEVTPSGRGQIVTHGLYMADELEKVMREAGSAAPAAPVHSSGSSGTAPASAPAPAQASAPAADAAASGEVEALRTEVQTLREELAKVKKDVADLWASLS